MAKEKDILNKIAEVVKSRNYRVSGKVAASLVGISRSRLYKLFQSNYHCGFKDYIDKQRLIKAKMLLRVNELPICKIANAVGFALQKSFSRWFKRKIGQSPVKYQYRLQRQK